MLPSDPTSEPLASSVDSLFSSVGFDFLDEEIDDVLFMTNSFLTDSTFTAPGSGPFAWILEMCMALGALFAIVMAGGMAFKMMTKGESFDVLKILRVLGIAIVMFWWYPAGPNSPSILGMLSYIPNCIGSYTEDLYMIEAGQVQETFNQLTPLIKERDDSLTIAMARYDAAKEGINQTSDAAVELGDTQAATQNQQLASRSWISSTFAGIIVFLDKIVMLLSLVFFRVGWWSTIFCQQILLGMLTIFGPIQWAFSILPKWEGAWAKWLTRYLTVHFYGAMLYFVGFYVLLLFDIVLSVQVEQLTAIMQDSETFQGYLQSAFITSGYLLVASVVSLKCLNLVPDLAAWMIPEGDTAFSTRNFGEGVASQAKMSATSLIR